jgi:hypothetical protein
VRGSWAQFPCVYFNGALSWDTLLTLGVPVSPATWLKSCFYENGCNYLCYCLYCFYKRLAVHCFFSHFSHCCYCCYCCDSSNSLCSCAPQWEIRRNHNRILQPREILDSRTYLWRRCMWWNLYHIPHEYFLWSRCGGVAKTLQGKRVTINPWEKSIDVVVCDHHIKLGIKSHLGYLELCIPAYSLQTSFWYKSHLCIIIGSWDNRLSSFLLPIWKVLSWEN